MQVLSEVVVGTTLGCHRNTLNPYSILATDWDILVLGILGRTYTHDNT